MSKKQGWGAGKFFSGSGSLLFFQPAPAPDFFPKRLQLRLLVFFSGSKGPKTPGSDRFRLLGKIFFSPQTSAKKYKTSKIIVFLTIKLNILPKEE